MNTTNFNEEYYLLYAQAIPNCPLVKLWEPNEIEMFKMARQPLAVSVIETRFMEPYPKNPVMADFHHNGVIDVVSQKLHDVLNPLHIKGIQMVPATIINPQNNKVYQNYFYLHIYQWLSCLCLEKSDYAARSSGKISVIRKMSLDVEKLAAVPQEERLIFRLGEIHTHQLFHQSVVDQIMATNPTGIRFVKVADFGAGSAFD